MTLRRGCGMPRSWEDGRTVVLSMSFEQMYLSDITLYVDN